MKWTLALAWVGICLAQSAPNAAGHWQGKIQMGDRDLAFTVDLDRNAQGTWIGSMTVTGSTSVDVPLGTVEAQDGIVRFTASLPGPAKFDGKLSSDGTSVSGTASNNQGQAPFQMTRSGAASVKLPPASSLLPKEFAGDWEGSLEVQGQPRRIALKLTADPQGRAVGNLIAVDQGNTEIAVSTVTIQGKELHLEVRAVSGDYRGTLNESGEIAGEWSQGASKMPLTFKRK